MATDGSGRRKADKAVAPILESEFKKAGRSAFQEIKQDYGSPRWTGEICDCSMPMTFDTYSRCSYDCLYCFAFYQKSHTLNGYAERDVRCVNPAKVAEIFKAARDGREVKGIRGQFAEYVKRGKIMQWGAMADPMDDYERRYGVSLELLRFFDSIGYPLSISTKGTFWTQDDRYMRLFEKNRERWHVKVSIITGDEQKARGIELGVPSPEARLAGIRELAGRGVHVTLRLRPYILGVSDDHIDLVRRAAAAGADSVTTEFFCMEARADATMKARYAAMSKIAGYDIWAYYMKNSRQHGYKRLSPGFKREIFAAIREEAHANGMRFHVSDAHGRDMQDATNCCGVPPEWNSQRSHFGRAVEIARDRGEVHWSDIAEDIEALFGFEWLKACGFNCGTTKAAAVYAGKSMAAWIRDSWNHGGGRGPDKAYGVLVAAGKDNRGDIVYRYTGGEGRRDGGRDGV